MKNSKNFNGRSMSNSNSKLNKFSDKAIANTDAIKGGNGGSDVDTIPLLKKKKIGG